jgi:hypothetical protein
VPILPLTSSQTPVFLVNSRLGHFTAPRLFIGDPFSQSYGVILPSSLARVNSSALVSSTHLPVSVCGTGIPCAPYEAFLVSVESLKFTLAGLPIAPQPLCKGDLPPLQLKCLDLNHHQAPTILLRHPFGQTHTRRYWNINQLSIGYASRPRLRPD